MAETDTSPERPIPAQDEAVESLAFPTGPDSSKLNQDPDLETRIDLHSLSREELTAIMEARVQKVGQQAFVSRASEVGTFENILATYVNGFSEEGARILSSIAKYNLQEDPNFTDILRGENGNVRIGASQIVDRKTVRPTPLSGRDAQIAYLSRRKGAVRRVPLLNSGISVMLRAPHIHEVSAYIQSVAAEDVTYGRDAGSQYFSFANFIVTRATVDFCIDLVVDCSLKDWDTKDRASLLKAIQLPDLNHLFMQVAALMYPNGYPNFRLACFNTDCGHETEPLKVDLRKFIRNRFALMPESCIKYLEENRTKSRVSDFQDLDRYVDALKLNTKVVQIDDHRYTLRIPSVDDYLTIGAKVVAAIIADTQGTSEDRRFVAISSRSLLTYVPWITKLEVLNFDEDPEIEPVVAMVVEDPDSIGDILSEIAADADHEQKLTKELFDFIDSGQLTYIAYVPDPCESCGHVPETKTGMVVLDPLASFFTLAYSTVKRYFMRKTVGLTTKD